MITFPLSLSTKTVYVDCAESLAEEKQLESLVSQTKFIADTFKRTGLYLVDDFYFNNRKIVVTSLRKRELLSPAELDLVKNELQSKTKEKGKARLL